MDAKNESREWKLLFGAIVVFLTVLPLAHYGPLNDPVMHAYIPGLFVIVVLVACYIDAVRAQLSIAQ